MYVSRRYDNEHYYCMFDEIPEITYEKVGCDYVGSAADDDGNIIFSGLLEYRSYKDAFAGRELALKMKDGTVEKIKDHWFDCGSYKDHGEFIDISGGTLEDLQECYVYYGYNINKEVFQKMLSDYYLREQEYEYYEIEKWAKKQYEWYPVFCNGKEYPFVINKNGRIADKFTKETSYQDVNRIVKIIHYTISFKKKEYKKKKEIYIAKLKYSDIKGVMHRVELNQKDIIKESLPFLNESEMVDVIKNNSSKHHVNYLG